MDHLTKTRNMCRMRDKTSLLERLLTKDVNERMRDIIDSEFDEIRECREANRFEKRAIYREVLASHGIGSFSETTFWRYYDERERAGKGRKGSARVGIVRQTQTQPTTSGKRRGRPPKPRASVGAVATQNPVLDGRTQDSENGAHEPLIPASTPLPLADSRPATQVAGLAASSPARERSGPATGLPAAQVVSAPSDPIRDDLPVAAHLSKIPWETDSKQVLAIREAAIAAGLVPPDLEHWSESASIPEEVKARYERRAPVGPGDTQTQSAAK